MKNESLWDEKVDSIHNLIVVGEVGRARAALSLLDCRSIPRQYRVQFAELARRSLMNDLALRLLRPIVRAETIYPEPTAKEKITYASTLVKIGALQEAFDLFHTLSWRKHPEVLLFESFGLFSQWEYKKATPLLRRYIRSSHITEYESLIGCLNLAAAHAAVGEAKEANPLITEVKDVALSQERWLIVGYTLELQAQVAMQTGEYRKALALLDQAYPYLKDASKLYSFFVRKWQAFCSAMIHTRPALNDIYKIRKEAVRLQHWETIRECDLYVSVISKDKSLFDQVYVKTPYLAYRRKMLSLSQWEPPASTQFPVILQQSKAHKFSPSIDVGAGSGNNSFELKPGQQLHRLLQVASTDLYRPLSTGAVFSELFADEYFDPATSVDRLKKAVTRLNNAFKDHEIPLKLLRRKGNYQLQATGPIELVLTVSRHYPDAEDLLLRKLKDKWPYQAFSTLEASNVLKMSTASTTRILKSGEKNGKVRASGNTRNRKYRFAV